MWDWASQANSVGMNKKNYSQPINAVKVLYFSKFRGKGHKQEDRSRRLMTRSRPAPASRKELLSE